ncbi:MAG: hypothetical protein M4579_003178 [Chaenotheca gracillima]|nr:MAG: hypothetical protein M4579_003178 [Chaenotheca gracillima]
MAPTPGILYVTMQPKPGLPTSQFHDWYNNEHGPTRLRLSFIANGFRYRATDLDGPGKGLPEWLAIYDVTDTAELTKDGYTRLRTDAVKSQREKDVMSQIAVDRRILDFVESRESEDFRRLEDVKDGLEENVIVAVSLSLHPGEEHRKELDRWYAVEHIDMLSKVPGWLRTRRFMTSPVDGKGATEYLALHEYAPKNGLGGDKFKAAISTPWAESIMTKTVQERRRRTYDLSYTFGPAPRDLAPLSSADAPIFTSPDGQTKTLPGSQGGGSGGAIESYVTTQDGVHLPYRLEGSSDPHAPLIVLSNSVLVTWGIWDEFITAFFSNAANEKYRVLRYGTRGRTSDCGSQPVTIDVLASDIIDLLDALRVPKAAALVGVSLGGATVLNAALKYPNRVAAFVSCDTNANSPAGNSKAWGDRIAVAEKEGASQAGQPVVGEQLAEMTTKRWFAGNNESRFRTVKAMVESNSLAGFKKTVEALFAYDLRGEMKVSEVRGAFVVGSGDGVLPGAMKEMAASYGKNGAEYVVVDGAGHLPMVEEPRKFEAVISKFLAGP